MMRSQWQFWGKQFIKIFLLIAPIILLWWIFQKVPFQQVWATLQQLHFSQIVVWLLVNVVIVIVVVGRWWLILRSLGYQIPYRSLTRYRFSSFAISYFTPGPQFGGEPLQVLALQKNHAVPSTTGTASVGLDKLLELIANFSFLVFGIGVAITGNWFPSEFQGTALTFALGLLLLPGAYLIAMLRGRQPLGWLVERLPASIRKNRFSTIIQEVEVQMSDFCVTQPKTVLLVTGISISVWVGMVFEYWLLIQFLGLRLSMVATISALVAARLAILTPLPGGLGALEASQVLALQTLGLDPAYGVSISLLIRFRDVLFGLIGLIGAIPYLKWLRSPKSENLKDV